MIISNSIGRLAGGLQCLTPRCQAQGKRRDEPSVYSDNAAGPDIRLAQARVYVLLPLGNQMGGTEQSRVMRIDSLLRPSFDAFQWH